MEKTIPIEVVLQDPNDPIVPTPEPSDPTGGETGTTETNIAVPNTGTDTNAGNNGSNSVFTNSAAIASIAILALTVIASIVLVVRRYYKRKKANTEAGITRQEKRAMAVTSTIAVLALTVLLGQLLTTAVVQPNSTNAATGDNSTNLTTPDIIQIVANRYDDVTIVASAKAISYASTTTSFGYKIFMSMAGDNANLYLDGDEESEYYFAPTENAGLDDNSWGYSLDGKANYTAMPFASDPLMAKQNTSAIADEEFTVYYTMKADKDMPFGVYSGEITYNMQGYSGFPTSLTTMQGMTPEICEATYTPNAFKADGVTIEDNVPTATLTDIRDNKTYTIAKLADGKCWMTQNLDLQKEDLLAGITLDNTNTNNPAGGFELPDSQTSGNNVWGRYQDEASINTAHVYDLNGSGQKYYYCLNFDSGPGECREYSGEEIPPLKLGNYYNWYTATAGTGLYSMTTGEVAGSICPKGWKLPGSSRNVEYASYGKLLYLYGILNSPTQDVVSGRDKVVSTFAAPLSFVPAGMYSSGVGTLSIGANNYLWSSSASGNSGAYGIALWFNSIRPNDANNRYNGLSIRCLAE